MRLTWVAPALAVVVLVIAAVGVLRLVDRADEARQAEVLVTRIEAAANRASAIEGQATAEGAVSDELGASAETALAVATAAQQALVRLEATGPDVNAITPALAEYEAAVRRRLELTAAGRPEEARRIDETRVDPGYEVLVTLLADARSRYAATARDVGRTTTLGILAILFLSAAIAAVLLWRFAAARRTAAIAAGGQRALRASEQRFRALVQNSSDVVTVVDAEGIVRYQSTSLSGVLGHRAEEWIGRPIADLVHPDDARVLAGALAEVTSTGRSPAVECRMLHRDGAWRDTETSLGDLRYEPEVAGIVLNTRDIGERKTLERELTHQAFHDSLTGLANRALFGDRAAHALRRRSERWSRGRAVHRPRRLQDGQRQPRPPGRRRDPGAGRRDRCAAACAPSDTVARLGGDEFAVLLEDFEPEERDTISRRILRALEEPIRVGDGEVAVLASIGVATDADAESEEELLRNADVAMYMAKAQGKGRRVVFEPAMHEALVARVRLSGDLRTAVERHELVLHYQPLVDLSSGRIVGFESLARWRHPDRGLLGPDEFIPLAEQTGLIVPIGRELLTQACRQARVWRERFPDRPPTPVSVNLSERQLRDPELVASVRGALEESGLDPQLLVLELTESLLIDETDATLTCLRDLRALGVRLAIDDFGMGYSSLSYLQRLPVNALKIDKSFVNAIDDEEDGQPAALVATIIDLAKMFGLATIGEGVEREEQAVALRRVGCRIGQGFHFAGPLDAAAATALLGEDTAAAREDRPRARAQGAGTLGPRGAHPAA